MFEQTWLCKIEAIAGDKVQLNRKTMMFWFAYLLLSVAADTVSLTRLVARARALETQRSVVDGSTLEVCASESAQWRALRTDATLLALSYTKNAGDIVLALAQLWLTVRVFTCVCLGTDRSSLIQIVWLQLSRTATGFSGTISSFIGWYLVWPHCP